MKGLFRNKQGSSLLEIVVAIAILGLMVAPVCSSLVLSFRLNADSEELLQSRLLVESTVEQLMAEGIDRGRIEIIEDKSFYKLDQKSESNETDSDNDKLEVEITDKGPEEGNELWYKVTVRSGDVEIDTVIRADTTPAGDPGEGGEGS